MDELEACRLWIKKDFSKIPTALIGRAYAETYFEDWDGLLSGYEPFFDEWGNQWDMPYIVKPNNGQVVITFYDGDIPEFIDPEDPQMLDMVYDALTYSILGYLGLDEQQVDVYG